MSKSERKLYWISGGAIAFLAAFAGLWQWINATPQIDIPSPKMPEPNGYDFYLQAGQAFVPDTKGIDEITDGSRRFDHYSKPRSSQQLKQMYPVTEKEAWLRRNAKALQLLHEGNKYPSWHPPVRSNGQLSGRTVKVRITRNE